MLTECPRAAPGEAGLMSLGVSGQGWGRGEAGPMMGEEGHTGLAHILTLYPGLRCGAARWGWAVMVQPKKR